jgi:hypothetical protein
MESKMVRKQARTNIYIIDEELYAWAQYRAKTLHYDTISDYLFDLVKQDKNKATNERKDGHGKNKKAAPSP